MASPLRRTPFPIILLVGVASVALAAESPENIAPKAAISADSEYSKDYFARFVADGQIPAAGSKKDLRKAWCVQGSTHRDGAQLTFEWPAPVTVAEIVYYGRTAWLPNENWRDFHVLADASPKPIAKGKLKSGHGPQRITLAVPVTAARLTMVFTSSYGGANPGASEIRIYASSPPDSALGKFESVRRRGPAPPPAPSVAESAELLADVRSGKLGFDRLLVVKRQRINPSHVYTYHAEGLRPGGALCLATLTADGCELRELVASPRGIILDAALSYDASTVLFSWKRSMSETFQLFSIAADGTDLRQVTDHASNNINPCWLADGGIAFLSDRKPAFAYCWVTTTPILYRSDADGSNVVRLSSNYLNDFTPSVLDDGRIIYSRWEYVDRPAIPIQSLWTINPDGTGLAGFFGNRVLSPATFMEARQIPGTGKVLCVLTSHNGPCRGAIGIVDPSAGPNARAGIRNLTPEIRIGEVDRGNGNSVRGPYESPMPVDARHFLVSRDGAVVVRDYACTAQATLLEREESLGYYSPLPIMRRPVPRPHSRLVAARGAPWASVLLHDVTEGLAPHVQRGEVKRIAVVQEVEKSKFASARVRAFGFQFPVVSCGATYAPKKVWGFARVESDGSAHFKVPTGVPVYFMALDEHGRAVQRMRTFTHFMPGEEQSCVGCHADRNLVAARNAGRAIAGSRPPQELEPPEWGVRGFSFPHIVQPVLDAHCVQCHAAGKHAGGVDLSADHTDMFNVAYETLARAGTGAENANVGGFSPARLGASRYTSWIATYNGCESNILEVTPKRWGSPASKLADLVLSGHPDKQGKPRVRIPSAERQRIVTWLDLNVPYYGTATSNHYNLRGCRQLLPPKLDAVLKDVASRRCMSCHAKGEIPRPFYTRVTNVENNSFLLAPLAKSAGGTERCGKPVFASREDPDYQAIVRTFEPISRLITDKPRMDMLPDAHLVPCLGPE